MKIPEGGCACGAPRRPRGSARPKRAGARESQVTDCYLARSARSRHALAIGAQARCRSGRRRASDPPRAPRGDREAGRPAPADRGGSSPGRRGGGNHRLLPAELRADSRPRSRAPPPRAGAHCGGDPARRRLPGEAARGAAGPARGRLVTVCYKASSGVGQPRAA